MTTPRFQFLVGVAAAAGALGIAAVISAAGASAAPADDEFLVPETSTFDPTSALGYPPLDDVLQGKETWELTGLPAGESFTVPGVDTQTTFGSFTNNDLLTGNGGGIEVGNDAVLLPFFPENTEIDIANFGGGFENEWINIPVAGESFAAPGISDLLITPFGNFELYGTYFSDVATALAAT